MPAIPATPPWERPLGARVTLDGRAEFRVWAPHAKTVSLRVGDRGQPLSDGGYGVYEATAAATAG